MENIGLILKERRESLNLSLEDMSRQTKLSTVQLQAIEDGNIEFFRDDLSYLTYFVRYYANALDLDFDEIRDELDASIVAYTDSLSVSKLQEKEEISRKVIKRSPVPQKKGPRVDLKSVSLILLAVAIIFGLGFSFKTWIYPAMKESDPIDEPVVVAPPKEEQNEEDKTEEDKDEEDKTEEDKEEKKELSIEAKDPHHYLISGWEEDESLSFEFDFNNRAWVRFSEDDKILESPSQGTYESGDKAQVIIEAKDGKKLSVNIGYMKGNKIFLNEEELELEPEAQESVSGMVLEFELVEGESEE